MEYRNVPNLRSVLIAASTWMAALAVLAAFAALGSRPVGETVGLGLLSGVCLLAALAFARYAFVDGVDGDTAEQISGKVRAGSFGEKTQSSRKARAA